MEDLSVLEVAKALSSETRLELIKTIGNESLSLYEIKKQFNNTLHRESVYRALEKLTQAKVLFKKYNKIKKKYEYSIINSQIKLNILSDIKINNFQEKYPIYKKIAYDLKNGGLFYIKDYKKLKNYHQFNSEVYKKDEKIISSKIISVLRKIEWKKGEYTKQHWGNWLHSVSPYVGRMTPSLAHWLIKSSSKQGDTVLDPFCGIGTVCLEADILRRKTIGIDLNPYAALIAKAKFERKPIEEHIKFLKNINLDISKVNLSKISPFIKQFFHNKTLKEIISLKEILFKEKKDFLLACLMGILHGNRPGYLSAWTGCIIPMAPRKPNNPKFNSSKDIPEYRPVIPRLAAKVKRMYLNPVPIKTKGKIYQNDARDLSFIKDNSINVICCSPPYYHTLDYVGANRLRLAILGFDEEKREKMKTTLIQQRYTYLEEMRKVGKELHRIMKPDSHVLFVLGDVHMTKKSLNTAEDIGRLYEEVGFKKIDIIDDEIPRNKCAVQNGNHKKKLDRILVLKTIK